MTTTKDEVQSGGNQDHKVNLLALWKRYQFLVLCFLFGILILIVNAATHPENKPIWESLVEEMGIAFVVASIIGAFVEYTLRKEEDKRHEAQRKALNENVFGNVLGSFAPNWITEDVTEIFKAKAIRSNVRVNYRFSPPPSDVKWLDASKKTSLEELVTVEVELGYTLKTLSPNPIEDPEIDHGFEPTAPVEKGHCYYSSLKVSSAGEALLDWQKSNGETTNVKLSDGGKNWNRRAIKVENFSSLRKDKPLKELDVNVKYVSVQWRHDHDTWVTWLPADKLTVTASMDSVRLDFDLEKARPRIYAGDPPGRPTKWISGDQEESRRPTGGQAERTQTPGGILPFQGFTFHWFPPVDPSTYENVNDSSGSPD